MILLNFTLDSMSGLLDSVSGLFDALTAAVQAVLKAHAQGKPQF